MNIIKTRHFNGITGVSQKTEFCKARSFGPLMLLSVLFTVAACGGGSDSTPGTSEIIDGGNGTEQLPSEDDPQPVDVSQPVDDSDAGNVIAESYTVSGVLTANNVFQVDSDVNDPFTTASDNNTLASAQLIPNPAIVKGFVTATPTGVTSDRFESTPDEFDIFRVQALSGQSIFLEIADFDSNNPATVDLDMGLLDLAGNVLEVSLSVSNSFEALVVPADGEYLLVVNAFSGGSNYTLSISTEFATTAFDSQISVANLRVDQLAMENIPTELENVAFVADMRKGQGGQEKRAIQNSSVVIGLDKESMANMLESEQNIFSRLDGDKRKTLMSISASEAVAQRANTSLDAMSVIELTKAMNSREGGDVFSPMQYPTTLQASNTDPVPNPFIQWNLYDIGWTEAQDQLQNISLQKRPVDCCY